MFVFFECRFRHRAPQVFVRDYGVAKQRESSLSTMGWDLNCLLPRTFLSSWNVKAFTSLGIIQGVGATLLAAVAQTRRNLA